MKISRLYNDADGESHWGEAEIENWKEIQQASITNPEIASNVLFISAPPNHVTEWHKSPTRCYMVLLAGESEYEVGDGTRHPVTPGMLLLMEDTSGRGHRAHTGPNGRTQLVVNLPD